MIRPFLALALFALVAAAQTPTRDQQIAGHTARANEALRTGKPDVAIRELSALLALDPADLQARTNLGVLLFFQGSYPQSVIELRRAVEAQPGLPPNIVALLGMAERRTGALGPARVHLESAFDQLKEDKLRVQTGMELVELDFSTGALEPAARIVAVLRQLRPTDVNVLYVAHRIYSQLADEAMLGISMLNPQSARMHQVMAQEAVRQGNNAAAIRHYRAAVQNEPNLPGIHFELAEALNDSASAEDQAQVEAEYKAALAANPFDEKSECRLAEIALRQADLDNARKRFTRALELQPDDADANFGLAKTLMALGKREEARAPLERAARIDPVNATIRFRLGTLYRELGRADDSRRELAEYQRLREMKENLRQVYQDMRLAPARRERPDDPPATAPAGATPRP